MLDLLAIDHAMTAPTAEQEALRIIAKFAGRVPDVSEGLAEAIPNTLDRELSLRAALEERFGDMPEATFYRFHDVSDVVEWAEGRVCV